MAPNPGRPLPAGSSSSPAPACPPCRDVIRLHGFLPEMRCAACGRVWHVGHVAWDGVSRRWPACGSRTGVKPNVVFFREEAPRYRDMARIVGALRVRDVLVVIGTSGTVIDVEALVGGCPAFTILNNLEPSPAIVPGLFDAVLHMRATDAAPRIRDLVEAQLA